MKRKLRLGKQKKVIDKSLLTLTFVLTILGLIAVADASAPQAMNAFNDKFWVFFATAFGSTEICNSIILCQISFKRKGNNFFLDSFSCYSIFSNASTRFGDNDCNCCYRNDSNLCNRT